MTDTTPEEQVERGGSLPDPGLERDLFLRTLVRELAGTLESTVGLDEAAGYISVVGRRVGSWGGPRQGLARGARRASAAGMPSRVSGCFKSARRAI